ncbi:helix-turn-helix transcriptional regulator [Streptomyces sp. 891-h]|uniref:helix-turn-helix domain-containing protein n=1 Tax=Streptomyces sp. 891-h TaxID=2720714 RepID=UPI002064DB9E|nr:helix-turn-helix transcriptional regulator [Streptomyces sp. 891-h]UNZ20570.1 helix-turn-helix domain-containing protein [Streptomyces sp. 891-h]
MEQPPATYQVNGAAVRHIRMRHGLDQKQAARAAGITASYLSRLETGTRTQMRPDTYAALRTALCATDDQLLAPIDEEPTREKR